MGFGIKLESSECKDMIVKAKAKCDAAGTASTAATTTAATAAATAAATTVSAGRRLQQKEEIPIEFDAKIALPKHSWENNKKAAALVGDDGTVKADDFATAFTTAFVAAANEPDGDLQKVDSWTKTVGTLKEEDMEVDKSTFKSETKTVPPPAPSAPATTASSAHMTIATVGTVIAFFMSAFV